MQNRLNFRIAERTDRGFDNRGLSVFLRGFFRNRAQHLKAYNRRAVLADDDVINIIRRILIVDKNSAETLSRDFNRTDDRVMLGVFLIEAERCEHHVLICRENC